MRVSPAEENPVAPQLKSRCGRSDSVFRDDLHGEGLALRARDAIEPPSSSEADVVEGLTASPGQRAEHA